MNRAERIETFTPPAMFVWLPRARVWLNLDRVSRVGEFWVGLEDGSMPINQEDYDIICALLMRLTNPPMMVKYANPHNIP